MDKVVVALLQLPYAARVTDFPSYRAAVRLALRPSLTNGRAKKSWTGLDLRERQRHMTSERGVVALLLCYEPSITNKATEHTGSHMLYSYAHFLSSGDPFSLLLLTS